MREQSVVGHRQAIIVLGMHRSGTSALSGVLSKLGACPPANLMPPTPDNPLGYWESTELMKFHDRVLRSAGSSWNDWERFNPDWIDSAAGAEFQRSLPALLEQEYGAAGIFLVKDPRLCRLLPLWLRALKELSITPKIIIPIRHPAEVSRSLGVRDKIPRKRAELIWLRHVLDAEAGTRDIDRAFLGYSHLLSDWREQIQRLSGILDIKWPRKSGLVEAEIDEYLRPELRHHVTSHERLPAGSAMAGWVANAYAAVEVLMNASTEPPGALQMLYDVREEFDRTSSIYASVVQEQRIEMEQRLSEADMRNADIAKELVTTRGKNDALQQESKEYRDAGTTLNAKSEALQQDFETSKRRVADLEASLQALQSEHARILAEHALRCKEFNSQREAFESELARQRLAHEHASQAQAREGMSKVELHKAEISALELRVYALQSELELQAAAGQKQNRHLLEALNLSRADLLRETGSRLAEQASSKARVEELESTLGKCAEDAASLSRAISAELRAHRELVNDYRCKLEEVVNSRFWRIGNTLAARLGSQGRRDPVASAPGQTDGELLRQSALLDGEWYLARYPDVSTKGMDPVEHFLLHGAQEGRDPSPIFSTNGYLSRYADVVAGGMNPLVHYIRYGREEGRAILAMDEKT